MSAENETLKFKIGDDQYEIPALDDLDMDEWQILYDYTGLILDDFAPATDKAPETATEMRLEAELKAVKTSEQRTEIAQQLAEEQARRAEEDGPKEKERSRRTSQPGFTRAMLHIGYRRAHPELKQEAIREVTGAAKLLSVLEAMGESASEEDESAPLASTTELAPSSLSEPVDSNGNESTSSPKSSDEQDGPPVPTGTDA